MPNPPRDGRHARRRKRQSTRQQDRQANNKRKTRARKIMYTFPDVLMIVRRLGNKSQATAVCLALLPLDSIRRCCYPSTNCLKTPGMIEKKAVRLRRMGLPAYVKERHPPHSSTHRPTHPPNYSLFYEMFERTLGVPDAFTQRTERTLASTRETRQASPERGATKHPRDHACTHARTHEAPKQKRSTHE